MIQSFDLNRDGLVAAPGLGAGSGAPHWFDLLNPSREERDALARSLEIELPTPEDMAEIEVSSRLYTEGGSAFMTALIPASGDSDHVSLHPITFILSGKHLSTIRYHDPRPFDTFVRRAARSATPLKDGETALLGLLEAIIDRLADILERAGRDVDAISAQVFGQDGTSPRAGKEFKSTLQRIGRTGDLTTKIKDSLVTLDRLIVYLRSRLASKSVDKRGEIEVLLADIQSLRDQSSFISQKITFLLDAILGLVNIEQAAIIKIFSVVSVVFLPPTLVASIYGMNFRIMPELDLPFGYPLAIALMVVSAVLPFAFFKRRGWL